MHPSEIQRKPFENPPWLVIAGRFKIYLLPLVAKYLR
jgi:hypothetical protein